VENIIIQAIRNDLSEEEFSQTALSLLRWQAEFNPTYQNFLKSSGLRGNELNNWADFPALPVAAFKLGSVTTFSPAEAEFIFETSGTTGKSTGRHYMKNGRCYERSLELGFKRFMPDLSRHRWISLVPSFSSRPHSSLAYMLQHLSTIIPESRSMESVTDGDFIIDQDKLLLLLNEAQQSSQPVALFATSFSLAQMAEHLLKRGISLRLPLGTVVFDTGGYKGKHRELAPADLLNLLEISLGVPRGQVWNEYGMTELSSQGYGKLADGLHRFPPWIRVRLLDPATGAEVAEGEKGLLHFYDLANVHSVMAVGTLDTGLRKGDAIRLLGRVLGAPERGCSLPFEL